MNLDGWSLARLINAYLVWHRGKLTPEQWQQFEALLLAPPPDAVQRDRSLAQLDADAIEGFNAVGE